MRYCRAFDNSRLASNRAPPRPEFHFAHRALSFFEKRLTGKSAWYTSLRLLLPHPRCQPTSDAECLEQSTFRGSCA